MADRLTQLQDCLDELLSQMFYAVRYIHDHAPYATIAGQPDQSQTESTGQENSTAPGHNDRASQPQNGSQALQATSQTPDSAKDFDMKLRDMAKDLVLREQQIEYIINSLPGIGNSQEDQERRMRDLEVELRNAEEERARAEGTREELMQSLGGLIIGCTRPI